MRKKLPLRQAQGFATRQARGFVSLLLILATFAASVASDIPVARAAATQSNQKGMNVTTYSEQVDNSAWAKTNVTIEANSSTSPIGTLTADTLRGNTTSAQHRTYIGTPAVLTLGRKVTFSIFAKAGTKNWLILQVNDLVSATGVNFDLTNGVKGTIGSSVVGSSITSVGNGWYRCSVTFVNTVATSLSMSADMANGNGVDSYAGTTADTMSLWGAQIEQDSSLHAYNRTVASTIGSTYTPVGATQSSQKGQNFFKQSQNLAASAWGATNATMDANAAMAPNGSFTATRMTDNTTNFVHSIAQTSLPTVVGRVYTYSAYFKYENHPLIVLAANGGDATAFVYVNAQTGTIAATVGANVLGSGIVSVGNGWYRAWNTFLANVNATNPVLYYAQSVGTLVYAGTGTDTMLIWGVQEEEGRILHAYNRTDTLALNSTYSPAGVRQSSQLGQNKLTFSEQIDNAIWVNTNVTIAANVTTAPNGSMTAERMTDSSDGGATSHYTDRTLSVVTGRTYTMSVYAKKGTKNFIDISPDAASVQQNFNVDTCAVGSLLNNSLGAFRSAGAQNAGGGWCRVWVTWVSGGFTDARIWILNADSGITYTGDGTGTVFLWGAQVEQNNYPRSYNRTTSATFNP